MVSAVFLAAVGAGVCAERAIAQEIRFGQNKVQYRDFEWKSFKTEHFEFFYHQGGEEIAEFAAVASEKAYDELSRLFRYQLTERVPIILYNSHNDFQQTNVIPGILQEGIGGFTEYMKHRVVVPFEGSYEDFRHVLHHELVHAVSGAMVWGTGVASLISRAQAPAVPLWFEEGLAEYASMGWDLDADAFVRDAVITGYLPPLEQIYGGMLAYKGGQAFFRFLDETYGPGRIAEILGNLRLLHSLDRAMVAALGRPVGQLSEDWHLYLKRTYWPEIEGRELPSEFARPLTDHQQDGSVYNVFPSLSPDGDRIAFISNRSQYMDLYVASTLDGRLISHLGQGEQAGQFEEMHILRGGLSWSPDGEQVALAAKGGASDRIYLVRVEDGEVERQIDPRMDGVFEPAWSPDGRWIAFVGIESGYSDLYLYDLGEDTYRRLTVSKASESFPTWTPDSRALAYVSDRLVEGIGPKEPDLPVLYGPSNIWMMNVGAGESSARLAVASPFDDVNPIFGQDGDEMLFISDRSGVRNIYRRDLATGEDRHLTNILTGVETVSWSREDRSLAFSAFNGAGFDIFYMRTPRSARTPASLQRTELVERLERDHLEAAVRPTRFVQVPDDTAAGDLSRLRFRPLVLGWEGGEEALERPEEVPLTRPLGAGVRASRAEPYRIRMTPDLFFANAGYYGYFGLAGSTYMEMSDILGNHRLAMATSLWSTLDNSNYQFEYTYLKNRLNIGGGLFYLNYFYVPEFQRRAIYADRNVGATVMMSYPFSRFLRVELETLYLGIRRRIYTLGPVDRNSRQVLAPKLRLVGDNTIPGVTGYINGRRFSLAVSHSAGFVPNSLGYTSIEGDWRSYTRVGADHSLVFRLAAGSSIGSDPQQFFLGGNGFWWGPQYARSDLYDLDNLYFASFQSPLRGYDFYELRGNRFLLTNLELRFPLIRVLALGWPVPLTIPNIRGALFADFGMAWNDWDVQPFRSGSLGLEDLKSGVGLGARTNLGFLILRVDVAWQNTLRQIRGKPRWSIALGPEF